MLGCVARTYANPANPRFVAKQNPMLYEHRKNKSSAIPEYFEYRNQYFQYFRFLSSTARLARRLFTQMLQLSDLGGPIPDKIMVLIFCQTSMKSKPTENLHVKKEKYGHRRATAAVSPL